MAVEAWERDVAARQAKSFLDAALALANYELEPSGAAAAHAKAYGRAAAAFSTALNATIIYLQDIEKSPKAKTREQDHRISQLWSDAHTALFAFDTDLAQRCFIKSQGWLDPSVWSSPEFAEIGVSIADMRRALLAFQRERGGGIGRFEEAAKLQDGNLATRVFDWWGSTKIGAAIIIIGAILTVIASYTDSVKKIEELFHPVKAESGRAAPKPH